MAIAMGANAVRVHSSGRTDPQTLLKAPSGTVRRIYVERLNGSSRSVLGSGKVKRLIRDDGVSGVSSSFPVMEEVIRIGSAYDSAIALSRRTGACATHERRRIYCVPCTTGPTAAMGSQAWRSHHISPTTCLAPSMRRECYGVGSNDRMYSSRFRPLLPAFLRFEL